MNNEHKCCPKCFGNMTEVIAEKCWSCKRMTVDHDKCEHCGAKLTIEVKCKQCSDKFIIGVTSPRHDICHKCLQHKHVDDLSADLGIKFK